MMVDDELTDFADFFLTNLVYCEDCHSFVHRLFNRWQVSMPSTKDDAEGDAFAIIKEMHIEFAKNKDGGV